MAQLLQHWRNNEVFAGGSANTARVTNPATGQVTGRVALGSVGDARVVIDAAVAAFPAWRDTSLAKRGAILFTFRELLNARKGELAEIIITASAAGSLAVRRQPRPRHRRGALLHPRQGHHQPLARPPRAERAIKHKPRRHQPRLPRKQIATPGPFVSRAAAGPEQESRDQVAT
jgi:hypothetical protein